MERALASHIVHHSKLERSMSQLGQYLPQPGVCGTSAYRRIADIEYSAQNVRDGILRSGC